VEKRLKPTKNDGATRAAFGIETSVILATKVNATEVTHDGATDHDVVEMGDDEIGVMEVDVQA
jgi:hypothetical protein